MLSESAAGEYKAVSCSLSARLPVVDPKLKSALLSYLQSAAAMLVVSLLFSSLQLSGRSVSHRLI
jgi:hypothetical protein